VLLEIVLPEVLLLPQGGAGCGVPMANPVLNLCQWLNDWPVTDVLREGEWQFGAVETMHILGLGFSVGTVMWLDFRLLGWAMRKEPVADVIDRFEPWAIGGFAVMFLSGILLVLAEPLKVYQVFAFRLKVIMLFLACLNVLYFHKRVAHNIDHWDQSMPWRAKMVAIVSLVLWMGIIIAGRWTAYYSPS
jgi:hypothetical protein